MASDTLALREPPLTDRARRARALVDQFEVRFRPTMPPFGSDTVPHEGRHVRCTAESVSQVYSAGKTYDRDARGRVTARGLAAPNGWSPRLWIVDCVLVRTDRDASGSRADPEFLRAQRRMADPAFLNGLGAGLRAEFPGRPVQTSNTNFFVPRGILFVREASMSTPLGPNVADDLALLAALVVCAEKSLGGESEPLEADESPAPLPIRRGHLRLVQ